LRSVTQSSMFAQDVLPTSWMGYSILTVVQLQHKLTVTPLMKQQTDLTAK